MHIVFPMTNALAADVPELLSVVGGKAIFLEEKSINNKNGVYTTYSYMCDSISQGEDLAVEYCDYLINNAPFVLVGAFENDYTRTSAQEMTNIMFNYVGSKNVGSFKVKNYSTKQQYICNVRVHTCAQYQSGIFEIYVSVGSGLTYGN
ncbi:MAG: hypothetical protein IKN12_05720 [Selenomonadaceae bacterium]|nr:hypothetical protein [Selenomonadaceae bacterium]MBR3722248.1 hypothetical protein [Selenomonadaceae bacterium]